ncbi:cytochrome C peroxidase [Chroococcidiopsis sp. CCALA 051]|uniref:cytochrome-c peroxidase n=1 Tax=Chroococcidiopsis sp. CCALA 051 TaxID=869949 RepID=UPI000D0CF884|nr:cytochrome c peroxidase [Chroococcidiopsis sp. CCALA 051]PSM48198.1 cytochrome C peroxidase [Chroococcidiopsis sp. CCALA 051]
MENNQKNFASNSSETRKDTKMFSSSIRWILGLSKQAKFTISLIRKISIEHKAIARTRKPKSGMAIATLVAAAIVAGHIISIELATAQTSPLVPLKNVPIPVPDKIGEFIRDKTAAIALGKTFFWDMQVGSDGIQACASCHFHAGADNRSKNQLDPGRLRVNGDRTPNPDTNFNTGGGANYQLKPKDFPFHKLKDPRDRLSPVIADSNDVSSSQGVFSSKLINVIPGRAEDEVEQLDDPVFNVQGIEVRRVEPRNTPTVINAVFNFRNFWNGRALNVFNGVNALGHRDPDAFVLQADGLEQLKQVKVRLNNSSLASQAVEPPTSEFEQSAIGRLPQLAESNPNLNTQLKASDRFQPNQLSPLGNKRIGKKLLSLQPLSKQLVHPEDSILGRYSNFPKPGLKVSYESLIQAAFQPQWWKSNVVIRSDDNGGTLIAKPNRPLNVDESELIEYNCALFFGLAVQAYESTLISDDAPIDRYLAGKHHALTEQQQRGLDIFQNKGLCIGCHAGAEFTSASVESITSQGRISRSPVGTNPPEDRGYFNIGVRPVQEDLGIGGEDLLGNSLSEVRLAQQGKFQQLLGENPPTFNPPLDPNEIVVADGAFKTPGLRNVELTAPYMHNGGFLTLEQVVDFYNRGGDFESFPSLPELNLTASEKAALVAFLKGLTDDRVRYDKAPFDHPQIFVPNGHPGNEQTVNNDGTGKATENLVEIPAVGRNGGNPLPNFLATQ